MKNFYFCSTFLAKKSVQGRAFVIFLLLLNFTAGFETHAQFSFSDNATSYGASWANGNNFGTGYNAWAITTGGANAGTFIGNPASNGMGTTNIGTTAFGLFGHGGQYVNATRYFGAGGTNVPMQIGDVFSFYWAMNWDAGSGSKGFDLRADGTTVFNVNNGGSSAITTSNGTADPNYGTTPMLVTLTRTSWTQYSFSMSSRSGGATYNTTINSASNINNINIYCGAQSDNNGNRNIYFNVFNFTKAAPYETNFNVTEPRILAGANSLTKTGAGNLTLTGVNTFTGNVIVNANFLIISNDNQLGAAPGAATVNKIQIGAGTLAASSSATINTNRGITLNNAASTIDVFGGQTLTYGGIIAGAGALNKAGPGILSLGGASTYTGGTNINAGTLTITTAANRLPTTTSLTLANTSGAVFNLNNLAQTVGALSGGGATGGNITLGTAALTINQTTNTTYSGIIGGTGAAAIVKSGTGTLGLGGVNTYTGTTSITGGVLRVDNAQALGTTGAGTTVSSGAALDLNGTNYSNAEGLTLNGTGISSGGALFNGSSTGATFAGLVALGSASSIVGGAGSINLSNTGTITGAALGLTLGGAAGGTVGSILGTTTGSLTKEGSGTWTLNRVNTRTGATSISAGTLTCGVAAAINPASALALLNVSGAVFNLNNFSQTVASLAGGGTTGGNISLGSATLTCNQTSSTSVGGVISGSGGLTKSGTGTLTLTGANTYTGVTTVTAGVLELGASGVLADASGLTLSGGTFRTGAAAGNTETAGVLSLTANSTLTLGTGSHTLTFANSSAASWTAATALTINGWTGAFNGTSGTAGRIFVGNTASSLTAQQISQIVFSNGTVNYTATLLSTGELVPIVRINQWAGTTSNAWLTPTNWTGSLIAGSTTSTNNDIAYFNLNTQPTSAINMGTQLGNHYIGALRFGTGATTARTVNNSSLTTGILSLNGTTLNGVDNTIIWNQSAALHTITNGSSAMNLRPNNAVANVIQITGAGGVTIASVLTGANSITKAGTGGGTLTLSGLNNYTGSTNINQGTLTCGLVNTLPSTTTVNLANTAGVSLSLGTFSQNISGLSGGGTSGGNVSLGTGTLTISGAATNTFSGAFSATAGNLVLNNAGAAFVLGSASNAHTGSTTLTAGTLRINPVSNATYTSQVVLNGGTLSTSGITASRTWTSSSTLNLNSSSTITLDAAVHSITFAASNAVTWNGSTLTINGWTGTPGSSGTGGRIFFGNSASGLTAAQRSKITITGFSGIPVLLASGELVPAPLPVSYTWNGATDNSWNTSTNWTPNGIPTESDHVTLVNGTNQNLSLASAVTVTNLTIDGNFSLTSAGSLSVLGNVTYTSGSPTFDCASTLNILNSGSQTVPALSYGNLNISGGPRVLASTGTITVCGIFTPSTSQTVSGSTLTLNGAVANTLPTSTYNNLNISGGASGTVTLAAGATLSIDGNLSVSNSTTLNLSNSATGGTINLAGNLNLNNGTILRSGASTNSVFNFMKSTGIQTISQTGGSVILTGITMNVGTGTSTNTLQLESDFVIGGAPAASPVGFLRVQANASLDFKTSILSGTGGFVTVAGSTLISANISTSGAFNPHPTNSGSLQNGANTTQRNIVTLTNFTFNGASNQVMGNYFANQTIGNLNINTSNGAVVSLDLGGNTPVNIGSYTNSRSLTLTSGILYLTTGIMYVYNDVQGGPFNPGKMIVTSQGSVFPQRNPGQLRLYMPSAPLSTSQTVNMLFPLGDTTGVDEYTPMKINLTYNATVGAINSPYFGVKCIDARNPYDASLTDYMSRYWIISTGTTFNNGTASLSVKCSYKDADVVGNEAGLKMNRFNTATLQNTEDFSGSFTDPATDTLFSATLDKTMFTDHDIFGRKTVPLYYRTNASGKWQNVNNWLISSDPAFISPAGIVPPIPPNSANSDSIAILTAHTITADTLFPPYTMDQVLIAGTLNVDSGAAFAYANGPASLDVNVTGTLKIAGTSGQYPGSVLRFGSTSLYHHATRANVSGTGVISASNLPIATWVSGSHCRVTGIRDYSLTPATLNQAFSEFTWDCPRQAFNYNALGNLLNVSGNLNIINTNGRLFSLTRTQPMAMTVGQNFNISGGNVLAVSGVTTGAASVAVTGNLNISGGSMIMADSAATTNAISATVTGTTSVSGSGSLVLAGSASSGAGSLTFTALGGSSFSSTSSPSLLLSGSASKAAVFNANGGLTQSAGIINLVASSGNATLNVADNQTLALNGGTLQAGSGAPGSVGTINVGTNTTAATTTALTLGGGNILLAASSTGTLNLYGDLNLNSGSLSRSGGSATLNFLATGLNVGSPKTQTLSQTSGTVSGTIAFNVGASNSFTRLSLGSNVNLGSGSSLTVTGFGSSNFSYLDFGPYVLSGQSFAQQNFATLATAHPDGFWTSGATGALQTTTRSINTTGGNFSYNGSTPQVTGNALTGCLALSVMNASGLSLSTDLTVNGLVYLDYFGQHGKLRLGNFNLNMAAGAGFSGQSSVDYVVTDGTGYVSMPVSTSAVTFPVGNSTYNPITLTPGAGASVPYRVRVIDGVSTPSPNDGSMLINRYWNVTAPTAPSNTITVVPQWSTGDENAGYSGGSQVKMAYYGTLWSEVNASQLGSNPYTSPASFAISNTNLNSGVFFGIGKDNGFLNSIVTYTWNGSSSSSWTVPANWTPGTSVAGPLATDNVIISSPGSNLLSITGSQSVSDFTLSGTGDFTIASGGSLNVTGTISNSSSATPALDCNSTFLISSAASQSIPAFNFGNLNASGGDRVLTSSGSIGICGSFTPGAGAYTISGSTVDFNGTGAQTINAFNFHNLSISGSRGANNITLPSGTVGIAGSFSPTASFSGGNYVTTGNTIDFNASGAQAVAAFNYNNLTISGARTTNNVTLVNGGSIGIAGAFNPSATFSTGSFVNTGNTIDFNSSGAQTIPAFGFYNNLSNSNNGARTLANGIIKISGIYSPTSGAITIGTSTIDFAGAAGQVIPASSYYNITNSSNTDRTLASSGIIDINAGFTPTTGITTINGSTVRYSSTTTGWALTTYTTNVAGRQYNNLTFAGTGGSWSLNGNTIGVAGNLTVTAGTLLCGTSSGAATLNLDGNLLVNGGTLNTTNNATNTGTINLLGNFSVSSGTFTKSGAGIGTVNFIKTSGLQTFSSAGTISNGNIWNLGNGITTNTIQFISNVSASTGVFNVNSGTIVDFGTNQLTVSTGTFTLSSGAHLITANLNGISTAASNSGSVNRTGGTAANISYSTGANYTYNGSGLQVTGAGFIGANNLTISNASNVTLSAVATVNGTLQFNNGYLDLGSNNLTIGAAGSISGAGTGKYVRTAGTGQLRQTVANNNSAVLFAVGRSAYNPLSLANAVAGTTDVYGVIVADAIAPALNSATKVVNRSWSVSESVAGGSNLQVTAQWNSPSEEAAGFAAGTTNQMALHNGSNWSQASATQAGSNPFTFTSSSNFTPASLTIAQVFAIGKDDAFICSAVPTISSLSITSGYSGDVITLSGSNLSGLTGATIGGTAATVGSQSGSSANITVLGGSTGTITVSSSPVCSGTSSQTFTYNGYISAASGNWNSGATWRGGNVPAASVAVTIDNLHTVTLNTNATPSSLTVNTGGTYTQNNNTNTMTVGGGSGTVTLNGTMTFTSALVTGSVCLFNVGTLTIGTGGTFNNNAGNAYPTCVSTFNVNSGGTYNHDAIGSIPNGASNDFPGTSAITINSNATINITKWAQNVGTPASTSLPNYVSGGQWGNLTINITGQTYSGSWQTSGAITNATSLTVGGTGTRDFRLTTANSSYTGNFGSINVSGGKLSLCSGGSTGSGTIVLNVSGATNISGGEMSVAGSAGSNDANTGTVTANFNGNVNITGGALYGLASNSTVVTYNSGTTTLNFNGDLGVGPGTFDMAYLPAYITPSTATGPVNVNLKGNLNLAASGTISSLNSINTGRATASTFNFNKATGTQTFSDAGTVSNHAISWLVNGGANTLLLSSAADLGSAAASSFTVNSGSTLDCGANVLSGGGTFTAQPGSTLRLGNANGITASPTASGNIQFGTRSFNAAANYVYSGSVNQSSGNGLPSTITGQLTIANTGSSGNNTVTLTTNNTTVSTLNLSSGLFAAGTGQNINLANAGTVNATGGDFATGASAGTITATGSAVFNGTSNPYNVYANGGINFGAQTVTIQNGGTFRINSGGFVNTNAPFYAAGSTLEYNTGGNYGRGLEWNASSGRGYPHHVTVRNNTNHQPGANGNTGTVFRMGGDLNIHSGSGMYLDWGGLQTTVNFTVSGSVILDGSLSLSTVSGDLFVGGNWSRTGTFEPRSREVVFNGSAAQTFTGPTGFDFFRINNTSSGLTLNSGLFINQRLQIDDGQIVLGNNDITLSGAAFITGGNASDYLVTNGTGAVIQNVSGGDDWYPVGPSTTIFGPVTLNQTGTADNISVRVSTAPAYTNAVNDNSKMVNLEWTINEGTAGGNNISTTFGWTAGSEAASFDRTAGVYHGNHNGTRYLVRATEPTSGSNPYYSLSTTSQRYTGSLSSQPFVIGNLAGIVPCLQTITTPGAWSSAGTWLDGIIPPAGSNVCIRNAITLSSSVANPDGITLEPGGSLNIANGTTLTLGSPGTITNSSGSFANMTTGSIAFSGLGVINGSNAIGFNNLELNGNTTLTTTPTINGTLEIKPGGFILSSTGPNYGASSTLRYNTGGNYNRSNEWNSSSGSGYPSSVQISGNTSLNISTGAAGIRQIAGSMTIDAGSSLTQDASDQGFIVPGNFTLNGSYSMSTALGGDLVVSGNWSSGASASLTHNNRDIRFDGSGAQTISVANGLQFGFLTVDNSGSGLDLLNQITVNTFRVNANRTFNLNTDKIIISASGNLLNNGIFNANGGTIEFTNGGSFTNNGTFNRGTSTVDFVGATAGIVTGTVQTNFHNIRLFPGGGIDFGSGALRGKVSGTLQLRAGSYVANNSPIYEPGSKLQYSGGGTFNRSVEWDPSSVQKVEVTNNTTLIGGVNGTAFSHVLADSLIVRTGSSLSLANGNNMTAPLRVGGHLLNQGTLTLSGAIGGDLEVGGDFVNNGTFNANDRMVSFKDSADAGIKGSSNTIFHYLTVDKNAGKTLTATVPFSIGTLSTGSQLRVAGGTFDLNNQAITFLPGNHTLRIDGGFAKAQTLKTGGTNITGFSSFSSNGSNSDTLGGKLNYSGVGPETLLTPVKGYNLLWITGGSVKTIPQNTLVRDSVLISAGSSLNFSDANLTLDVKGHVVNNGSISGSSSSKLLMSSTSARSLVGSGSMHNLDISNAAGVSVSGKPVFTNTLRLLSGKMLTGTDTVVLGPDAKITETYNSGSYLVGKAFTLRYVGIDTTDFGGLGAELTAGDDLDTVRFLRTSGVLGECSNGIDIDTSINWNWIITPNTQPDASSPNRQLKLTWPSAEDNNLGDRYLRLYKRDDPSDPSWEAISMSELYSPSILRTVVWEDVTGFSQFTLGEGDVPLSLNLISLSAKKERNYARIEWEVSPDASAKYYQLEKSVDNGRSYESIGTYNADENQAAYFGLDYRFLSDSYYRIRVVKEDGSEDVSRSVFLQASEGRSSYLIVPNPSAAGRGIRLQSGSKITAAAEGEIRVYSSDGRLSMKLRGGLDEMNSALELQSAGLPAGVYQLQVQLAEEVENLRFVKE